MFDDLLSLVLSLNIPGTMNKWKDQIEIQYKRATKDTIMQLLCTYISSEFKQVKFKTALT